MSETQIPLDGSEQRDFLPLLIQIFYFVAPLEILMVFAGTTELTAGMVGGGLIGAVGLLLFASSQVSLSWRSDRPIAYMLLFICLGALSTSQTIYGMPAIQKGAINLAAVLAMVFMAIVVKQSFVQWPRLFPHVVRITAVVAGIAGLTAIVQSFVSNVLSQPELFDLSFLNAIWGTNWWRRAVEGGLVRAQGIFAEPSFLAVYVGMASGLAMVRLGLIGSKWRRELRHVVPAWAAASVLGGLILTFSAVAYAGLLAAFLGTLASKTIFRARSLAILVIGSAAAMSALAFVAVQAGNAIVDRVAGLAVFGQLANVGGSDTLDRGINLTVQILFLNAYVTLQNLIASPWLGAGVGAHPFAYQTLLPAFPVLSRGAVGLNAMDAGALALRLLSETGFLGTAAFTAAVLSSWFRVRKTVIAKDVPGTGSTSGSFRAIAVGLNGGLAGVFVAMLLHIPHYYAAEFWALFALCAAVPTIATSVDTAESRLWRGGVAARYGASVIATRDSP